MEQDTNQTTRLSRLLVVASVMLLAGLLWSFTGAAGATSDGEPYVVFDDSLQTNWRKQHVDARVGLKNTRVVYSGSRAANVTYTAPYGTLLLNTRYPLEANAYDSLQFWIHGGRDGGQVVAVSLVDGQGQQLDQRVQVTGTAGEWQQVAIKLDDLGSPGMIGGILWQEAAGASQPILYLDEIVFMPVVAAPTAEPTPIPTETPPPSPTPAPAPGGGAADEIYGDSLDTGWENWSWSTSTNFSNSTPIHEGTNSLAVTYDGGWAGLYLHSRENIALDQYEALRFWIHGGDSGQRQLLVKLADGSGNLSGEGVTVTAPAGSWSLVEISLSDLGAPSQLSGIAWQESTGSAQPVFYLDDVALLGGEESTPPPPSSTGPALYVDANAVQHEISPDIYGMNFANETMARELNLPVNRWGGNATTRYNWQLDISNRASDWFFENIPNENVDVSRLPHGSSSDQFVGQNQRAGTATIMTVPLIGWTPRDREYRCGYSVAIYGAQQQTDSWRPDCGNGILQDGTPITWNDPAETSVAIGPAFVQDWLRHLTGNFGNAAGGGVRYYALDNEPFLWDHTHRDVHPDPVGYDEIRDRTYAYGAALKAIDPTAMTLGPALWGWTAYFYSGIDSASGNWNNPPDRNAHGGTPFVEWYLQQMQAYERTHGVRILDYLDLHFYPQASGVALSPAGNEATQARRLRSTRALWDPTYVDESWINEPVNLIPRMRQWVERNYPGTRLALTEYNWGGLNHINGALAQADILGIFGREGLDLATLWDPPTLNQPGAFAFRMYRNYDGAGSTFGDQSLLATSDDQDRLAVYAAQRSSDGALTIIVVNKSGEAHTSDVTLAGVADGRTTQVYQYGTSNLNAIEQQPDLTVQGSRVTHTFPANSITLLVLP